MSNHHIINLDLSIPPQPTNKGVCEGFHFRNSSNITGSSAETSSVPCLGWPTAASQRQGRSGAECGSILPRARLPGNWCHPVTQKSSRAVKKKHLRCVGFVEPPTINSWRFLQHSPQFSVLSFDVPRTFGECSPTAFDVAFVFQNVAQRVVCSWIERVDANSGS